MVAKSAHRVEKQTDESVNQRIAEKTRANLAYCAAGGPQAIERRLRELEEEWDVERALETLAPSFALTGIALSVVRGRKWLLFSGAVLGFLVQHAVQGWCPPLVVLRSLGFRTRGEIDQERYALKALRGDFSQLPEPPKSESLAKVEPILDAVQK